MVEIADIVDTESLRVWLKGRPREVSIWIGHRAAMRVLPFYWDWVEQSDVAKRDGDTALPVLHCNLISGVESRNPSPEVRLAAKSIAKKPLVLRVELQTNEAMLSGDAAAITAYSVYQETDMSTIHECVRVVKIAVDCAANVSPASASAVWETTRTDCVAIAEGSDLDRMALWPSGENSFVANWNKLKSNLVMADPSQSSKTLRGTVPVDWSFWIKWYDSVLAGEPLNGDMPQEIALIAPAEWEKGAEVVNPLIAKITARYEMRQESELTPRQALSQNSKAVIAQLEALKTFVEEEIQRIRSANNITDQEQEQINVRVVALQSIIEAITKMVTALADADQSPENALVVIEEQLPKVINEAEKLAAQEPEISEMIVVMGATVEHLTKCGMPGHVASGIAVVDVVFRPIRKWFKRDKKNNNK